MDVFQCNNYFLCFHFPIDSMGLTHILPPSGEGTCLSFVHYYGLTAWKANKLMTKNCNIYLTVSHLITMYHPGIKRSFMSINEYMACAM